MFHKVVALLLTSYCQYVIVVLVVIGVIIIIFGVIIIIFGVIIIIFVVIIIIILVVPLNDMISFAQWELRLSPVFCIT